MSNEKIDKLYTFPQSVWEKNESGKYTSRPLTSADDKRRKEQVKKMSKTQDVTNHGSRRTVFLANKFKAVEE